MSDTQKTKTVMPDAAIKATVTFMPGHSGDGYGFGGGTLLTVRGRSLFVGEDGDAHKLATEIAAAINGPIVAAGARTETPEVAELVNAAQEILLHACLADADPRDVDEEDRVRERNLRAALLPFRGA